ncbi:exonuclease SbcCD subunit D [Proteus mirabilis]|uniref:exonuclease SbcCD subunit D n=1 Tax=Proteus mirabilis TaxID=584 RepID=UPI0034D67A65
MKKRKPCIVVHTSDWHAGFKDFDSLYRSVLDPVDGFVQKVREIIEQCKEEDIEFGGICLEGDLYHTKLSNNSKEQRFVINVINLLINIVIVENNAKIILLRGTIGHEFNQIDNFKSFELNYPGKFEVFNTVGTTTIGDNYSVLVIPEEYMPESEQEAFYAPFFKDKKYDMTVMHAFFDFNCFSRNSVEKHFDGMPIFKHKEMLEMSRLTIAGHDHRHQIIDGRLAYNGSLISMTYSEDGEKGFIYTYMDDDEEEIYFVENVLSPTFKTTDLKQIVKGKDYSFKNVVKYIDKEFEKWDNLRINIGGDIMAENPELILLLRERYFRESKLRFEGQSVLLKDGRTIDQSDMEGITIREENSDTISSVGSGEFEFILDDRKSITEKIIEFIKIKHPGNKSIPTSEKTNEIISDKK